MGKRKQFVPKKVGEGERKNLTWNMLDTEPSSSGVNIIADDDPVLQVELENATVEQIPTKIRKTDGTIDIEVHMDVLTEKNPVVVSSSLVDINSVGFSYGKDDLLDIFDLHVQNCPISFQIWKALKTKTDGWHCVLARFDIRFVPDHLYVPLPVGGLPNVESFTLHIGEEGEKNVLCYNLLESNNSASKANKSSKQRSSENRNMHFWFVDIGLPSACLEALKCKKLKIVVDSFDSEEMLLSLKIIVTEEILAQLSNPSEAVRPKMLNESLKVLMQHFYGISVSGKRHFI